MPVVSIKDPLCCSVLSSGIVRNSGASQQTDTTNRNTLPSFGLVSQVHIGFLGTVARANLITDVISPMYRKVFGSALRRYSAADIANINYQKDRTT